jgi:hypothetical protein
MSLHLVPLDSPIEVSTPVQRKTHNILPTSSINSHTLGGKAYGYYIHLHPLLFLFVAAFLVLYVIKFVRVYFHNLSVQNALLQQGEPFSCFERSTSSSSSVDLHHNHLPSFTDAVGAFWKLIGYKQMSSECEEWHRRVSEWNIPDPGDIGLLVVTSFFTQPVYYVMDAVSLTIETFFSRQSVLVTVLIFLFVSYALKLFVMRHNFQHDIMNMNQLSMQYYHQMYNSFHRDR